MIRESNSSVSCLVDLVPMMEGNKEMIHGRSPIEGKWNTMNCIFHGMVREVPFVLKDKSNFEWITSGTWGGTLERRKKKGE